MPNFQKKSAGKLVEPNLFKERKKLTSESAKGASFKSAETRHDYITRL